MTLTQYLATFPNLSRPLARRRMASPRHFCGFLCRHEGFQPLATLLRPCYNLLQHLPTFYNLFYDILQSFESALCKSYWNEKSHDLSRPFPTFSQPFYNLLQHFTNFYNLFNNVLQPLT